MTTKTKSSVLNSLFSLAPPGGDQDSDDSRAAG